MPFFVCLFWYVYFFFFSLPWILWFFLLCDAALYAIFTANNATWMAKLVPAFYAFFLQTVGVENPSPFIAARFDHSHMLIAKYCVNAVIMSKHSGQLWYCVPFSVDEGGTVIRKVSIVASGGVEVNNDTSQISTPT